jgi:DNA-binding XRE family transcriptional regulator
MKTEKHAQAYNLYFQTGLSQSQIAKLLDVDRKTVHNWMSEGNWRKQKKLAAHMPSKIAEQQYYMLANIGHEILSRGHQPYPLEHEADRMRKIAITIRHIKNRQTVNEAMESYTHLAEAISYKDPVFAAQLRVYIQDYIQGRVDVKFADLVTEDYQFNSKMDEMYDYEIHPDDDDEGGIPANPVDVIPPDTPGDTGGQPAPQTPAVAVSTAFGGRTAAAGPVEVNSTASALTTDAGPAEANSGSSVLATDAQPAELIAEVVPAEATGSPAKTSHRFPEDPTMHTIKTVNAPVSIWHKPDEPDAAISVPVNPAPDKPVPIAA